MHEHAGYISDPPTWLPVKSVKKENLQSSVWVKIPVLNNRDRKNQENICYVFCLFSLFFNQPESEAYFWFWSH